jgi:hypothetical protein
MENRCLTSFFFRGHQRIIPEISMTTKINVAVAAIG